MNYLAFLYIFALFYVFIPGTVITLPVKASKMVHTMIHALLFSIILFFTYHSVSLFSLKEGQANMSNDCTNNCINKCTNQNNYSDYTNSVNSSVNCTVNCVANCEDNNMQQI